MGRPWWYDDYWKKQTPRRPRLPRRQLWVWMVIVAVCVILPGAGTGFRLSPTGWMMGFVSYFCNILAMAVFVNALLSWFRPGQFSWPVVILNDITEPILQPLRRYISPVGGFDFTPLIAIVALSLIPSIILRIVAFVI